MVAKKSDDKSGIKRRAPRSEESKQKAKQKYAEAVKAADAFSAKVIPKNPGGAPSFPWTEELEIEICDYIRSHALSLKQCVAANPHWPKQETIYKRLSDNPKFTDMYLAAKHSQIHAFVEETNDISQEAKENSTLVPWANMTINLRKWQAARLMPRIYGDKVTQEVSVINHEESLKKLK